MLECFRFTGRQFNEDTYIYFTCVTAHLTPTVRLDDDCGISNSDTNVLKLLRIFISSPGPIKGPSELMPWCNLGVCLQNHVSDAGPVGLLFLIC